MPLRKFFRFLASTIAALSLGTMGIVSYYSYALPGQYSVFADHSVALDSPGIYTSSSAPEQRVANSLTESHGADVELSLFGMIPIKEAHVTKLVDQKVIPCGTPFGVKMLTNGVMVIGLSDITTKDGVVNPAEEAGIQIGDVITSVNGISVSSNEQIGTIVSESDGEPISVELTRDDVDQTVILQPAMAYPGSTYKAGIWVRDSSAGIGIITFCLEDGVFGGLGHPICDVDTGAALPLGSGEIVEASINGIKKGYVGEPGELCGTFTNDSSIGIVDYNSDAGIFGELSTPLSPHDAVEVGLKQEVKTGPATIYTTLSGEDPQEYDIEILSVNVNDDSNNKNMVIKVTDPELLAQTGGIVQGMSGSPILQNGKLVGAVTHVFVNDPTKGYGIFAENMLEVAEQLEQS